MIIKGNSATGKDTKVLDAAGNKIKLLISEYNTETQEATFYVPGEGSLAMSKHVKSLAGGFEQEPMKVTAILPGSYAEIDGEKV